MCVDEVGLVIRPVRDVGPAPASPESNMSIIAASKYGSTAAQVAASQAGTRSPSAPAQILIPTAATRRLLLRDWWHKETKEGGLINDYVRREKHQMPQLMRNVARVMASFKQNNKSDFRLIASVPARLYQRLKNEDPDFFSDNQNLRNLRRDNPDAVVKL